MAAQELQEVLQSDAWGVDLLLSCLAAAASSYRKSTCTMPFPSSTFEAVDGRDYAALLATVQSLPPAASLADAVGRLSHQQAALLHWLLAHPRRPARNLARRTLRQVQEQMPEVLGWVAEIGKDPNLRPHAVIQLAPVPASVGSPSGSRILAFHGTSTENMHSILHNGLMNLSGTRLERTGAAFGKGIYFSTELSVAASFCQATDCWQASALGRRLRCLLVCSIEREHALSSHNSSMVPDRYIVVERMDAVQMHFVFVYADDAAPLLAGSSCSAILAALPSPMQPPPSPPPQQQAQQQSPHVPALSPQQQRGVAAASEGAAHAHPAAPPPPPQRQQRSPLLFLLLAYLAWLCWVGLRENWPAVRRMLRRQLGVRI